jgi:hypothetical protein
MGVTTSMGLISLQKLNSQIINQNHQIIMLNTAMKHQNRQIIELLEIIAGIKDRDEYQGKIESGLPELGLPKVTIKTCKNCNEQTVYDDNFCQNCGEKF